MLFKEIHLQGIKSSRINLAFCKKQKTSVKEGSRIHTFISFVEISKIETVNGNDINDKDTLNAGFTDKKKLLKSFSHNSAVTIFKISVCYDSEDPRIKLREQSELLE